MQEVVLYRKHATGVGSWRIRQDGNVIRIAHATCLGGAEVEHEELIPQGLAGRTLQQQIDLRMRSRISRMKDRGYKDSYSEALVSTGNQLGLLRPMLAHPLERVKNPDLRNAVLQKKLDGHRCLVTKQEGELIAYSRQGKIIDSIKHILPDLAKLIPEGETIDGELYLHGQSLQTIASWIKREQPGTYKLMFVAYDMVSKESYVDRHAELESMLMPCENPKVIVLPHMSYTDDESMYSEFRRVRNLGFEGLMLRLANRGYEDGKRSSALIKVKEFHDDEFEVIDIVPSKDGWGICVCRLTNGATFRTSAPGSHEEKTEALRNKHKYIGRMLTVEYSVITEDGIPFHPNATRWQELV